MLYTGASWQCSSSCSSKTLLLNSQFEISSLPLQANAPCPVLEAPACLFCSASGDHEDILFLRPSFVPSAIQVLNSSSRVSLHRGSVILIAPLCFPLIPLSFEVQRAESHTHLQHRHYQHDCSTSLLCQICRTGDKLIN